jgi:hypothetical protein
VPCARSSRPRSSSAWDGGTPRLPGAGYVYSQSTVDDVVAPAPGLPSLTADFIACLAESAWAVRLPPAFAAFERQRYDLALGAR